MKNGILLLFIVLVASCSSHGPMYKDEVKPTQVTIPMSSYSIQIVDSRDNVSEDEIEINWMTVGGEQDSVSAPAPSNLHAELSTILDQSRVAGEMDIRFQVEIVKGIQTFHANGWQETEYVEVILNISAYNSSTNEQLAKTQSKSWGERASMDASHKRMDEMYLSAFKHAFRVGLEKLAIQ